MGVVDLLGIISFFLLSLVVRKLVVGYLKDTNAGEWVGMFLRVLQFRLGFPKIPTYPCEKLGIPTVF